MTQVQKNLNIRLGELAEVVLLSDCSSSEFVALAAVVSHCHWCPTRWLSLEPSRVQGGESTTGIDTPENADKSQRKRSGGLGQNQGTRNTP